MQIGPISNPARFGDDGLYCWGCKHNLDSCGRFSCHHPDREYEKLPFDNHCPQRCPVLKMRLSQGTKHDNDAGTNRNRTPAG